MPMTQNNKAGEGKSTKYDSPVNSNAAIILRKEIYNRKIKCQAHFDDTPGHPDIIFKGPKIAVFVGDRSTGNDCASPLKNQIQVKTNSIDTVDKLHGWTVLSFSDRDITDDVDGCVDIIHDSLNKPKYGAFDLFAGIGGIRLGFERAFSDKYVLRNSGCVKTVCHLRTTLVSDINPHSLKTYYSNFPKCDTINDVYDISEDVIKQHDFDICLAGFPCQAFSMAGKREGEQDSMGRGVLFYQVLRICNAKHPRPKVIFFENVKGLLSMNGGKTFKKMKKSLEDIGYKVFHQVLNSLYFGVPQNRERIYIVAFDVQQLGDVEFNFPEGRYDPSNTLDKIWDPNPTADDYITEQYLSTLKRHREYHESRNHGFGYVVKHREDVSSAVMCGGMGRERNMEYDPKPDLPSVNSHGKPLNKEYLRFMTPREWELLQGFEPGYTSAVPKTRRYQQLGNSVTVPVIEAIARNIRAVLEQNSDDNRLPCNGL